MTMIGAFAAVAAGGALGASARFGLGLALARGAQGGFPVAVLGANILGSFLMGLAVVWLGRNGLGNWQPFVMTGVLGGFTTFSAFSLEAFTLWEQGQGASALAYVALSVIGAIGALVLGVTLARMVLA